jgi:hypothetical protein
MAPNLREPLYMFLNKPASGVDYVALSHDDDW